MGSTSSEYMRAKWQDPEYRARRSAEVRRQWQDPEYREKRRESAKKRWGDPQYREMVTKASRAYWQKHGPMSREHIARLNSQHLIVRAWPQMTPQERQDYRFLRNKKRLPAAECMRLIGKEKWLECFYEDDPRAVAAR